MSQHSTNDHDHEQASAPHPSTAQGEHGEPASSASTVPFTSAAKATTDSISTSDSNTAHPHSMSTPSVAHEEAVGRPVARKELPPDVQARIEKNRLAALERRANYEKRIASDRAIAREFGEDIGGGFVATEGGAGEQSAPKDFFEVHAKAIDKAISEVEPLPKNGWTKFYDYDLSKMKDTRAGFIQELDEQDAVGVGGDEEASRKRKWQPTVAQQDPSIFLGADDNYECQDCTSVDVDFQILRHFHVPVCIGCRDSQPDKYSLLTKTECRMDYLLTDPELRDTELFPFWERPNPKKATWNNMMLYLRCQVEDFAFKKWGGPEGLDQEFERRERDKAARKEIKFKKQLRDLRNKTRTSVWQDKKMQQRAKVHKHNFGTALVDPESGASVQTCNECGIQVECEEFF